MRNLEARITTLIWGGQRMKTLDPFIREVERISRFNGVMTLMPFNPVLF